MQVIIPMSGMGQRFVNAGYTDPKPLIVIDGKPIIEHVVEMFTGETKFIFICNSKHLKETNMRSELERIAPNGHIVEIAPHKLGPVYAVKQIEDLIEDQEEVIVNYCDFAVSWDYHDFLKNTRDRKADGAVPAYKGFHPHMLGTTNYAFMRSKEQWMLEIKEKEPFTDNRMQEFASTGTYYFRKGEFVKKYFSELIERNVNLNGEFYVSLIYNLLVEDGLSVSIYDIQHMLQWGTPGDVEEYNNWSKYFTNRLEKKEKYSKDGLLLIPMAGAGKRFKDEGYKLPKPMIDVNGNAMILQALEGLPNMSEARFVCQKEHLQDYELEELLVNNVEHSAVLSVDGLTEGQASTCKIGLKPEDDEKPLLISACDNGVIYDFNKFDKIILNDTVDAVVWTFKNHPSSKRKPEMYGWVELNDDGKVSGVSVKKAISDHPENDNAIVGTFYFKKTKLFFEALEKMYKDNIRVNGEFYVDSMVGLLVEMGYSVEVFEVDDYICWGTPNDLRTYEYWQSFFHKTDWHPYSLDKDPNIDSSVVDRLNKKYREFDQEWRS